MQKSIKYIVYSLLFAVNCAYAIGPNQSERYFKNNGGLIDRISPLLISPQNATAIQNITLDNRGQLSKRNGYSIINSTGNLTLSAVTGGAYHNAASGSNFFAVVVGTNVYRTGNTFNGTFTKVTGTTTITSGASNLVQTTNLNDKVIFCNESDQPFYLGSTGNAVAISTTTITGAKTCTTYGVYLVAANTTESGVTYPSRVRWSDINNQNSFPTLNYIDVEPNDGDKIVAVVTFEDSTYIFKKHSIYKMLITGLDGPDAFVIRPYMRGIGSWAKNSVKVIPNVGIAFLAQNTAYLLSDNGLEPIGDPIQRTFDSISRAQYANAVAEVYPKRYQYWLSVSLSGTTNDTVLVYDYIQKAWTLYNGMNVNMLSQAEDSNGNALLLSGDYLGNVYKQDNGTSDNPSNVQTAISASYTTADLNLGTPEYSKNFKYLYIFSQVDSVTNVTVNAFYDYNASAISQTLSLSLGSVAAVYDTAVYDTDIYPAATYKVSRIELNREAKAVKLQFINSTGDSVLGIIGWSIVYTNVDWKD